MRNFYAVSYPYGKGALNSNTQTWIRDVYAFESKAERDTWVDSRTTDYVHNNGYREAITRREMQAHERDEHAILEAQQRAEDEKRWAAWRPAEVE